jgi:hypothetical protein
MQGKQRQHTTPCSCVESVYRVYEDGRRERFATVLVPAPDGGLVPGPTRPTGRLGRFVEASVGKWRRVQLDARGDARPVRERPVTAPHRTRSSRTGAGEPRR